jgi:penicillin-binding protein 1A
MYTTINAELPTDLGFALDYRPNRASIVYSSDKQIIGHFFLQRRFVVPLDRIPEHVRNAFIAAEDTRFWVHRGFDPMGIVRAAYANWTGGSIKQGASTITQQVMRMLMLSPEKSYHRKAKELILAWRVERELSKRDILRIYLNHVYLGSGAYGVEAAAQVYFGKNVEHLTVAEATMLAGLPQSPSRYSPRNNFAAARSRQRYVLNQMVKVGMLSRAEADAAFAEALGLVATDQPINAAAAPYFVEHIRRWATERYGHRSVFFGGLRIHTTLDAGMQHAAETAVRAGLEALDAHLGFRGTIGHLEGDELAAFVEGPPRPFVTDLDQGAISGAGELLVDVPYVGAVIEVQRRGWRNKVVVDVGPNQLPLRKDDRLSVLRWRGERGAQLRVGDLIPVKLTRRPDASGEAELALAQKPDVQGGLVAIDPATGRVEALVGGYDYTTSQFNRATQARRQAGSAIKPFIYAAALDRGFTHLSIVPDSPVKVKTAAGVWSPKNFKPEYLGPITLRTALAKSINTVSVRLVLAIGVDAVVETMRALGIRSKFPRHVSIALGTPDMTLLEMTSAYATFPSGGRKVVPRFIDYVTTDDSIVLEDHRNRQLTDQAISPQLAYLVADLMKGVVQRGTGRRAQEIGRPAAGKTGTSTGFRDAWFIGYTADLIAGVWVGRDDFTPIGHNATGGTVSLPIWVQFMKAAHPPVPARDFTPPPDILFVRANEETGAPMPPGSPSAKLIPFARSTVPERFMSSVHPSGFRGSDAFPQRSP